MSIEDDFRRVVSILRDWGFKVTEWSGAYGRGNGSSWSGGKPAGHINHHFVCSTNPSQSYINSLVQGLADNKTVNWFADVHGVAYLVGTRPLNHAGTGNQSVLDRTRNDQAPTGPAGAAGSISGNSHYSGTECQHPGDYTTPWAPPMVDVMVAINAAEFIVWGYSANRAINHYEWTSRKIDMSWLGGINSGGKAGNELRARVQARMSGTTPQPPKDWFDMATEADLRRIVKEEIAASNKAQSEAIPGDVWGFKQTSKVTGEPTVMAEVVLYTNQHTEPSEIGGAVWTHDLTSMVSNQPIDAGDMLAYTNKNTEPA